MTPNVYHNDRSVTPCRAVTAAPTSGVAPVRVAERAVWCRAYTPSFHFLPAASHPPSISKAIQATRAAAGGGSYPSHGSYRQPELRNFLLSAANGQFEDAD